MLGLRSPDGGRDSLLVASLVAMNTNGIGQVGKVWVVADKDWVRFFTAHVVLVELMMTILVGGSSLEAGNSNDERAA